MPQRPPPAITAQGLVGDWPRALPKICLALSYVVKKMAVPRVSRTVSVSRRLAECTMALTEVQTITAIQSFQAVLLYQLLCRSVSTVVDAFGQTFIRLSRHLASNLGVELGQFEWT